MGLPRIVALMPTYRRPEMVANALACFLCQDYPNKKLLICDDSGELRQSGNTDWTIIHHRPFLSLSTKYNFMAQIAIKFWDPSILVVMEDDDVYFRRYLSCHFLALLKDPLGWSHNSKVWTDGSGGGPPGPLRLENTNHAKLHGCIGLTRAAYENVGGWVETKRMDFDLQFLARLGEYKAPMDPGESGPPQYYFRWASTGHPHGQAYSNGPGDENWMAKAKMAIDRQRGEISHSIFLAPVMDDETQKLYDKGM